MKIQVHSEYTTELRGHVVVIGSFDPWRESHDELVGGLVQHGLETQQPTAIVWLYPSPRKTLGRARADNGTSTSPGSFLSRGVDKVLEVALEMEDINGNAFEFLNKLRRYIPISEMFLGPRQSLGSGPLGSHVAIRQYCQKAHINLYLLLGEQIS